MSHQDDMMNRENYNQRPDFILIKKGYNTKGRCTSLPYSKSNMKWAKAQHDCFKKVIMVGWHNKKIKYDLVAFVGWRKD